MNFFAMDQENSRIVCTAMIWIYLVSTGTLTSMTVMLYFWLMQNDKVLTWKGGRLEFRERARWIVRSVTTGQNIEMSNTRV